MKLLKYLTLLLLLVSSVNADTGIDLINASKSGQIKRVKELLAAGADINSKDEKGLTPLLIASARGNKALFELLIVEKASLSEKDVDGNTVLHYLVDKKLTALMELSVKNGLNIDEPNSKGETAFHKSIKIGKLENARFLRKLGASSDIADNSGNNALLVSYKFRQYSYTEELLKEKTPFSTDAEGNSILHLSLSDNLAKQFKTYISYAEEKDFVSANLSGKTVLSLAIEKNKDEYLKPIFDKEPGLAAKINESILLDAYKSRKLAAVKILLEKGADPNKDDADGKSLIFYAVESGDNSTLAVLIKTKVDINDKTIDGKTPLIVAIEKNKTQAIELLLLGKADVNIPDPSGNLPIVLAVRLGLTGILKPLVNAGADINSKSLDGKSLLIIAHESIIKSYSDSKLRLIQELVLLGAETNISTAQGRSLIFEYAERGYAALVKSFIEDGTSVEEKDKEGNRLLHISVIAGKDQVVSVLLDKGAAINSNGNGGNTALIYAARAGNFNLVKNLLKKGADVNKKNTAGDSPVSVSIQRQDTAMMKELIGAGADVLSSNTSGNTPLMEICKTESFLTGKNTLDIISALLKAGSDVNKQNIYGNTALTYTINRKNGKLLNALLTQGAKPEIADKNGNNALHKAVLSAQFDRLKNKELTDILTSLIRSGMDLNIQNKEGLTALSLALKEGLGKDYSSSLQAAKILLNRNADFTIADKSGKTALEYGKSHENPEISAYFSELKKAKETDWNYVFFGTPEKEEVIAFKTIDSSKYYILLKSGTKVIFKIVNSDLKTEFEKEMPGANYLEVDKDKNIYIYGTAQGNLESGMDSKCKEGENLVNFLYKLDSAGKEILSKQIGEEGACSRTFSTGLAVDSSGQIYVGAVYGNQGYLMFLTPEGELTKTKRTEKWNRMEFTAKGNLVLFGETVTLLGEKLQKVISIKNDRDVALDKDENFYRTGIEKVGNRDEFYLEKISAQGKQIFKSYYQFTKPLQIVNSGDFLYIAGESKDSLHGNLNPDKNTADIYIMKVDREGGRVWTKSFGGSGNESFNKFTIDSSGKPSLAGTTDSDFKDWKIKGETDIFIIMP